MKILALIDVAPEASVGTIRAQIANELKGSRDLFASGALREAYPTGAPNRIVFVLEADSTARAEEHLHKPPLVAVRLLHLELIELRPFVNWEMLFAH
jgi:hypothetical protein